MPGSDDNGEHDHVNVYLAIAPSNIPDSTVVRIDDQVQYASHVVNVRDADFGDSRILGGDTALNLPEITKLFYEHFADEYEIIAGGAVSRLRTRWRAQFADYGRLPGRRGRDGASWQTRCCATTSPRDGHRHPERGTASPIDRTVGVADRSSST